MPTLAQHQSNNFIKMLICGDSKSGKTGALASLVAAGYSLRILDFDNGLDVLKQFILKECPEKIDNVEYQTLRDKRKSSPTGPIIDGVPRAFVDAIKLLDRWKFGDVDLGVPAAWGEGCILVLDSLTFFADAAFDFREPLVPRSRDGRYDIRAVYKDAQDAVENVLALLTSEHFRTNVIVISHVRYVDNPDGTKKGYPTAVGSALSPTIPRYFNTLIRCNAKHFETVSSPMFDLATPKPFGVEARYPISTGLAQIFEALRAKEVLAQPAPAPQPTLNPIRKLR